MTTTYSTVNEAVHYEIITPLNEYVDEFDIEAITDDLIIHGREPVNPEFCIDPDKDFWAVVESNARQKSA